MPGQMLKSTTPGEQAIRDYWNAHPCGDHQVGSLKANYEAFFARYDKFRYRREGHILRRLNAIDFKGKRVLEIGLGEGAESEQIIRRWRHLVRFGFNTRISGASLNPTASERNSLRATGMRQCLGNTISS